MSNYTDLAGRIKGAVVPIPVFFNADDSIDYRGVGKYLDWLAAEGIRNFCLTFVYSMLDMISEAELVELAGVAVKAVNRRGVVLGCTAGGAVGPTLETVRRLERSGIDGLFVHPTEFMVHCNGADLYVRLVQEVARHTDLPLLVVALRDAGQNSAPMLTMDHFDRLADIHSFIGLKEDMYLTPIRIAIAEQFGARLCTIGGGDLSKYLLVHHLPNQSEFAGMLNPSRGLAFFERLQQNDYQGAIRMLREDQSAAIPIPKGLHWLSTLPVQLYAKGFAATYRSRLPLPTATDEQAETIFSAMREHPQFYGPLAFDKPTMVSSGNS